MPKPEEFTALKEGVYKSKFQKFNVRTLHRRQIKKAPYNPRDIDPFARKKLLANIKDSEVGLLEPLVWNEVTEELVSGHQRLGIIDELEAAECEKKGKKPDGDFYLDISVVRMSAARQKAQVVFMNNQGAQGQFNPEGLKALFKDPEFVIEDSGFERMDAQQFFPDDPDLAPMFQQENQPEEVQDEMAKMQEIAKMKEAKKKYRDQMDRADDGEFILIVVFENRERRKILMEALGRSEYDRYADGEALLKFTGLAELHEKKAEAPVGGEGGKKQLPAREPDDGHDDSMKGPAEPEPAEDEEDDEGWSGEDKIDESES